MLGLNKRQTKNRDKLAKCKDIQNLLNSCKAEVEQMLKSEPNNRMLKFVVLMMKDEAQTLKKEDDNQRKTLVSVQSDLHKSRRRNK